MQHYIAIDYKEKSPKYALFAKRISYWA